jgi:hypothetical protein
LRTSKQPPATGISSGIAVTLRPINIVVIPLLWLMGQRAAAIKAMLSAALFFGLTLPFAGWSCWKNWLDTVRLYEIAEADPAYDDPVFGPIVWGVGSQRFGPTYGRPPPIIEGADFGPVLEYAAHPSDVIFLLRNDWAIPLSRALAVGFAALAFAMMWWMAQKPLVSRDILLMLLALTPAVLDFMRTTRFIYADVTFLPVFALLVSVVPRNFYFVVATACTVILYAVFFEIPFQIELARSILLFALVVALLLYHCANSPFRSAAAETAAGEKA